MLQSRYLLELPELPMPKPSRLLNRQLKHLDPTKVFDPRVFLSSVGIGRSLHEYKPGHAIFTQGQRAGTVFYIQAGTVRLSVLSAQGKVATIALLGSGDFLGEGCIAAEQPVRMATATAATGCTTLRIEKSELLRTLHEEPKFADMFVKYVVARHNRTQSDLVDQLFNSTEKRLARTLIMLTHVGKEGDSVALIPGITQRTLAEMVGTTRSHVNVFLNRFKKLGFIDYEGGLRVHSSLLSVVLHE
jgi:CRP/FNR family transcriptional regulator, cyclic AMP receptor protein